jgi:hypothetical protein
MYTVSMTCHPSVAVRGDSLQRTTRQQVLETKWYTITAGPVTMKENYTLELNIKIIDPVDQLMYGRTYQTALSPSGTPAFNGSSLPSSSSA